MPGGDRTGPLGMGPMTGRGVGWCAGFAAPGYAYPGAFWGRGRGRGWRNRYWATGVPGWAATEWRASQFWQPVAPGASAATEIGALQEQATALKQSLDAINKRLAQLEAAEKGEQ